MTNELKQKLHEWFNEHFDEDTLLQMQKAGIISQAEGFRLSVLVDLDLTVDDVIQEQESAQVGIIDHALMNGVAFTERGASLPHGTKLYAESPMQVVNIPDIDGNEFNDLTWRFVEALPACDLRKAAIGSHWTKHGLYEFSKFLVESMVNQKESNV